MRVTEVIRKRKIPIAIASIVIVGTLLTLLVFVPLVFGEQFVSSSFKLEYVGGPGIPTMEVVYINGSAVPVVWIGLSVNVTNSYLLPVEVSYNGFEFVWLIYNQTVTDPADVVGNRDFLVWGAFSAGYYISWSTTWGFYGGVGHWPVNESGYESGYEYYVARKDLSNYTKTIPVGTLQYHLIFDAYPLTCWGGQDLRRPHNPVSPGTYYIYPIVYGKVSEPINLTASQLEMFT